MSSCKPSSPALVVEFIGVTGVGKSTLLAGVSQRLSDQGLRIREAEDLILARYGLNLSKRPKLRSALVHVLSVWPFLCFLCTRDGFKLSRLAIGSILRGMGSFWIGVGLLRNFLKRMGSHLLLENACKRAKDCDLVLCDEGVVHAAHNLFVHTKAQPKTEDILLFGRLVPKPDLLIWITAPTTQSADVIHRRGHSRVRDTEGAALAFAERAHATFEVLAGMNGLQERIRRFDNSMLKDEPHDKVVHARVFALSELLKRQLGAEEVREVQQPQLVSAQPSLNGFHD